MNQEDLRSATIQGDLTVLVERNHPSYTYARDILLGCAQLEKCPEYVHTYRITALSLWNAAGAGATADSILDHLGVISKYPLPSNVVTFIRDTVSLYGKIRLIKKEDALFLQVNDSRLRTFIANHSKLRLYFVLEDLTQEGPISVNSEKRGLLKVALIEIGYPVVDEAGYTDGASLDVAPKPSWSLREYQREAIQAFFSGGNLAPGGSGVLVLPCGAGKTIIGISALVELGMRTLILTPSVTAARQWISEILNRTTLTADHVGEYSGDLKDIRPVTVATYQILTSRKRKTDEFPHLALMEREEWGLIIYDEVHLLPAPVFQMTAGIQARRRLGLTATLVREDRKEGNVFSLIGPKKFEVPWKILEGQGWIAKACCTEVRVELAENKREEYMLAENRDKFRIAATNPAKLNLVRALIDRHPSLPILVISMYIDQLHQVADALSLPLIEGATPSKTRDILFQQFRDGKIRVLAVSKVANFAVDLPDAAVAIEISGTFGSRQEEAQRLGRILRPKSGINQAHFYTIVTKESEEMRFALNRQLFLIEQGYEYQLEDAV